MSGAINSNPILNLYATTRLRQAPNKIVARHRQNIRRNSGIEVIKQLD
jgi:hypothetical protein